MVSSFSILKTAEWKVMPDESTVAKVSPSDHSDSTVIKYSFYLDAVFNLVTT